MRRPWKKYPPVSDMDWSYPETSRVLEALVKSAFYSATNGKNERENRREAAVDRERGAEDISEDRTI